MIFSTSRERSCALLRRGINFDRTDRKFFSPARQMVLNHEFNFAQTGSRARGNVPLQVNNVLERTFRFVSRTNRKYQLYTLH